MHVLSFLYILGNVSFQSQYNWWILSGWTIHVLLSSMLTLCPSIHLIIYQVVLYVVQTEGDVICKTTTYSIYHLVATDVAFVTAAGDDDDNDDDR